MARRCSVPVSVRDEDADTGSAWSTLRAWRATRLPWARFGPLALLLACAAGVGSAFDPHAFAMRCALAYALVAQFRLWDDLADRGRDRIEHPQRVLGRMKDARALSLVCAAWGGANASVLLLWNGAAAAAGLVLLGVAVGTWYRLHAQRGVLHAHALLLKYPAFVLLLAGPAVETWAVGWAAVAVYAAVCSFELLDETDSTHAIKAALAAHGIALTLAACGPAVDARGLSAALLVAILQGSACLCDRAHRHLPGRAYWPFLALVVVIVRHSLGDNA